MKIAKDLKIAISRASFAQKGFFGGRADGHSGKYRLYVGRAVGCRIVNAKGGVPGILIFGVHIEISPSNEARIFRGLKLKVERSDGMLAMETKSDKQGIFWFVLPEEHQGVDVKPLLYRFSVVS